MLASVRQVTRRVAQRCGSRPFVAVASVDAAGCAPAALYHSAAGAAAPQSARRAVGAPATASRRRSGICSSVAGLGSSRVRMLRPLPSAAGLVPTAAAVAAAATGAAQSSAAAGCGAVRSLFGQAFDVGSLSAQPREETGSRRMRRARKRGLVPGVLYGRHPDGSQADPILLHVEEGDLAREVRARGPTLENTLYDLTINGETIRALPRQLEKHPFKPNYYRINFIRYNPGQHPGARIRIPFKTMNEDRCPALKEGGWLLNLQYTLPVFAKGETIPDYLMLDLRGKKVGAKVNVSEVYLNDGLTLRTKQGRPTEFPVAKLVGSRRNVSANQPKQSK